MTNLITTYISVRRKLNPQTDYLSCIIEYLNPNQADTLAAASLQQKQDDIPESTFDPTLTNLRTILRQYSEKTLRLIFMDMTGMRYVGTLRDHLQQNRS